MARKLLIFMTGLAVIAVLLGIWLPGHGGALKVGWVHATLLLVLLLVLPLIGYHGGKRRAVRRFPAWARSRSHASGFSGSMRSRCCF
jgi:uncharacterized membrane protein